VKGCLVFFLVFFEFLLANSVQGGVFNQDQTLSQNFCWSFISPCLSLYFRSIARHSEELNLHKKPRSNDTAGLFEGVLGKLVYLVNREKSLFSC